MIFILHFLTYFTMYNSSKFTQLSSTDLDSFLYMGEWYSIIYMYHNSFIHSSVNVYLSRLLPCPAIVNSAAMNTWVHVSFWIMVFSGHMQASLVTQTVKCLSAVQETWVWSLGWEDPLEKGMTAHSSTLAWKIPWMEEPGRLQSMG